MELTVEDKTPNELKTTINTHYNGTFLEPWDERSQRGYGIEVIERFVREVAYVEKGGPAAQRAERLKEMRALGYNDLSADRQVVAAVQALEAILEEAAKGNANAVVTYESESGRLSLARPGVAQPRVLHPGR